MRHGSGSRIAEFGNVSERVILGTRADDDPGGGCCLRAAWTGARVTATSVTDSTVFVERRQCIIVPIAHTTRIRDSYAFVVSGSRRSPTISYSAVGLITSMAPGTCPRARGTQRGWHYLDGDHSNWWKPTRWVRTDRARSRWTCSDVTVGVAGAQIRRNLRQFQSRASHRFDSHCNIQRSLNFHMFTAGDQTQYYCVETHSNTTGVDVNRAKAWYVAGGSHTADLAGISPTGTPMRTL